MSYHSRYRCTTISYYSSIILITAHDSVVHHMARVCTHLYRTALWARRRSVGTKQRHSTSHIHRSLAYVEDTFEDHNDHHQSLPTMATQQLPIQSKRYHQHTLNPHCSTTWYKMRKKSTGKLRHDNFHHMPSYIYTRSINIYVYVAEHAKGVSTYLHGIALRVYCSDERQQVGKSLPRARVSVDDDVAIFRQ